MWNKKLIVGMLMASVLCICGCGNAEELVENQIEAAKEQIEWAEEHDARTNGESAEERLEDNLGITTEDIENVVEAVEEIGSVSASESGGTYSIGETVPMYVEWDGGHGEYNLTITGWEAIYNSAYGETNIGITYTVENTGEANIFVGDSMFAIYADDYAVEESYMEDNMPSSADLSSGRKFDGILYGKINPENASNIELECGDVVFVLKESAQPETTVSNSGTGIIPDALTYSTDAIPYMDIAGSYSGIKASCSLSMYSSFDGEAVGVISINDATTTYSGEIIELQTNVYQVLSEDGKTIIFGVSGTSIDDMDMHLFIDGVDFGYLVMTEHYVS